MTNFEKIKAMSLNELAVHICNEAYELAGFECTETCPGYKYCRLGSKGTIDYLKQEAKEE